MKNDYIYIKLCGNESIKSNNIKVKLKNKCNKIVFEGMTDNFGKIKIPICDNEVYRLIIYSNLVIIIVPLIAKSNKTYCINIGNNKRKEHLITVLLKDKNYPNMNSIKNEDIKEIEIEGGKIILWQDIQSQ